MPAQHAHTIYAARPRPAATGRWRAWASVVILGLGSCFTRTAGAADALVVKDYELKAAFLYSFTKFVEWPARCFPGTNSPIVIGVVGKGPLCAEIERAVKGRKVNGREL